MALAVLLETRDLSSLTSDSVVRSILKRELGAFKEIDRFGSAISRQLIRGRNSFVKSRGPTEEDSESVKDFTTLNEITATGEPASVIILNDKLLIRRHIANQPYHCVQLLNKIQLPQKTGLDDLLEHSKYQVPAVKRWTSWDAFYPSMSNPYEIIHKKKFEPTLLVLEKDQQYLFLYDIDSGRPLGKLFLDEKIKFSSVERCWFEMSKYMLQSVKSSLPMGVLLDFIILSYPPLNVFSRCRIFRSAFPRSSGIKIAEQVLFVLYSNFVEICDLKEIFTSKAYKVNFDGVDSDQLQGVHISHTVQSKLPVLIKVDNCTSSFLAINSWGSPPWCISKTKKGLFKVFTTNGGHIQNQELVNFQNTGESESTLSFHCDDSGRLILCSRNELRVMSLNSGQRIPRLEVDFYKKFHSASRREYSTAIGSRRSSRTRNTINYCEEEVKIKWKYDMNLDTFTIMQMEEESLRFFLFDNQLWYNVAIIEPYQFRLPSDKNKTFYLPPIDFDVTDSYIVVTLGKTKTDKVFLLDMLAEAKRTEE